MACFLHTFKGINPPLLLSLLFVSPLLSSNPFYSTAHGKRACNVFLLLLLRDLESLFLFSFLLLLLDRAKSGTAQHSTANRRVCRCYYYCSIRDPPMSKEKKKTKLENAKEKKKKKVKEVSVICCCSTQLGII